MITMSSWVLSVPAADQELGFEGENLVHTISIKTDTGSEWVYRIELAYANGKVDILLPEYKDGTLTVDLRWTELCVPGTVTIQVRGTRGYKVKLSTIAVMYIREAINATEVFNSGMPTEFEQLEQDLYAARDSAALSETASTTARAAAELAASKAASDASRAESARAAAELAVGSISSETPITIDVTTVSDANYTIITSGSPPCAFRVGNIVFVYATLSAKTPDNAAWHPILSGLPSTFSSGECVVTIPSRMSSGEAPLRAKILDGKLNVAGGHAQSLSYDYYDIQIIYATTDEA